MKDPILPLEVPGGAQRISYSKKIGSDAPPSSLQELQERLEREVEKNERLEKELQWTYERIEDYERPEVNAARVAAVERRRSPYAENNEQERIQNRSETCSGEGEWAGTHTDPPPPPSSSPPSHSAVQPGNARGQLEAQSGPGRKFSQKNEPEKFYRMGGGHTGPGGPPPQIMLPWISHQSWIRNP